MSDPAKRDDSRQRRHRRWIMIGLAIVVAIFIGVEMMIQQAPAAPVPVSGTVLLHAITWLNVILLLVLLFVLGRNLIKLFVERRRQKLGSKFGSKLVITYTGLALVPTVILFLVGSDFIQKSVDRWFSTSVEEVAVRSRELVRRATEDQEQQLLGMGDQLAAQITEDRLLTRDAWQLLRKRLSEQIALLQLDAITVYQGEDLLLDPVIADGGDLAANGNTLTDVPAAQVALALSGQSFTLNRNLDDNRMLLQAGVPVYAPNGRDVAGLLVSSRVLGRELVSQADAIETLYLSYIQGNEQKEPIKTTWLLTFLLLTLLILFATVWVGLYLARGVTVPIQLLAEGTREVASGNLDYRVEIEARDELGTLVTSFNQMTVDLQAGQSKLQQSRSDLERTITELEERRGYMEAVLANIATGVVSLNAEGVITTFNSAAQRMLGIAPEDAIGRVYDEILAGEAFAELRTLMDEARPGRTEIEKELTVDATGQRMTMAAHCSGLRDGAGQYLGTVVVLDDLTDLIRAQKTAAWREVARRIAHEIRNPLTPIQLSAQRIARRYGRAAGAEGEFDLIDEGTRTILQEVNTLKGLVDEFSRFARMPSANPVECNVHAIVEDSLLPTTSMHEDIRVVRRFCNDLPQLQLDPGQMRRAFTNLFDNAVKAMEGRGTLWVSTTHDADLEIVRIEIADSGPGILAKDKDRLFLPYFSRESGGTGLGLAIVHQIVSDHQGYIRVADNQPRGARFVIELPA